MKKVDVKTLLRMILIALSVAAFDQGTKALIVRKFNPGQTLNLIPGVFDLTLTFNKGAAFGMLSGLPDGMRQLMLGIATATALLAVLYFLFHDYYDDLLAQCGLALILGGALGNIVDRIRIGVVVDFLDFYYGSYHWPAFNVADSAICVGVAILLFRPSRKNIGIQGLAEES
jgi:signal peptidase II